jgi:hypothetical protein
LSGSLHSFISFLSKKEKRPELQKGDRSKKEGTGEENFLFLGDRLLSVA